jgi:hypothetical protein
MISTFTAQVMAPAWLLNNPEDWRPGTLDTDRLHADAAELQKHPSFDEARIEFITHFLQGFDAHPVTRRVMRNLPLYMLMIFSLYLHHLRNPAQPDTGITAVGLQALFSRGSASQVFASPTRVKDMLSHARLAGLLRSVPLPLHGGGDSRKRPLEPTQLLMDGFSEWILGYLRGSSLLLPAPFSLAAGSLSQESISTLFSYRVQAYVHDGFTSSERFGLVRQFMMRDHGYSVFLQMMKSVRDEGGEYVANVSASDVSRYRGISRATVRNALADAEAAGHLRTERGGTRVVLAYDFYHMAQHWFAVEMLWMHGLACAVVQNTKRPLDMNSEKITMLSDA